ncbi:ribosome biogenesis protein BOP1 homolog isoform X1 [Helianthus annuus]|uniref:ribosome biogenesis protein BOP1 homolog isoform X1 n=1 Tax=Helianthus annuus TaxID=4232 RepID=UPI000B8F0B77|nr:ribosome biogenesis protein BOP1 homolog isoform X1 [Helianthus annuus]
MKKNGKKNVLKPVEKEVVVVSESDDEVVASDSEHESVESPVVSDDDYEIFSEGNDDRNSDSELDSGSGSEDEVHGNYLDGEHPSNEAGLSDGVDNFDQGDQSASEDSREVVDESDSSEDEVGPRNTIGDVPLKWYEDEEHIGYDVAGKKIKKKERLDKLDSFLARTDDANSWRKIMDDIEDEEVELTKEETKLIRRMLKGKAPHADFDPHAPYVDWFAWDGAKHPLSNAPEPKRRFIPSKWESKKVVKYIRAIRKGLIKFDKPKEEPRFYNLWGDETEESRHGLSYIPAPKAKLPGHDESYNPSLEYIPTQEEISAYQLMFEEDRPKFIPKRFTSLRSVPAYEKSVRETFDRCLDLYLCPRARKKRINIDPESLKPKLPSRKDLKPYPTTCYLEYKGHKGPVVSICTDPVGQHIASGSHDGTVRIWEVETGRCIKVWELGEPVQHVAWNPLPEFPILAVSMGQDVLVLNTGLEKEENKMIADLLRVETTPAPDDSESAGSSVSWSQYDKYEGIRIKHFKTVSSVEWHRKGDYFSTVMPAGESKAILIHLLSKKLTQRLPFKLHGLPVCSTFHPTRSIFFVSTKKNVRVYDLVKKKFIKKLDAGVREISSVSIHPGGDNVIVGSKDGKLCWFDMDLSSKPYKILKSHPKDITNVAFHRNYPLFASSSDDCTAYVFHGMVYSDLNQNPLIVPLEILHGHTSVNGRGVLDCKFHPRQPWLFTAGADAVIKLFCH